MRIGSTRRHALAALLLMGGAAALAKLGKPSIKLADLSAPIELEAIFPRRFGHWQIDPNTPVILPAPDVQAKLDAIYNQVLSRTYVNAQGYRVMLSVAYGGDQSDGMSLHLPEVCYPAQGFEVSGKEAGTISVDGRSIPVHRLLTRLGGRVEPVTYWITIGDDVAPSRTQQKLVQIRYGIKGQIPDGMLVRISSIDRDGPNALRMQAEFADEMGRAIPEGFKTRVLGRTG
jgi:EpsI family protein